MGIGIVRKLLHEAAIRYAVFRDDQSARILEETADRFGSEKRHARERREKWRERREARNVGDGVNICRVVGCRNKPEWRPVLLFPPIDGMKDKIRVETAMLDVCDQHARILGPETYTENPDVWNNVCRVWTDSGMEAPDPDLAEVQYERVGERVNGT